MKILLIQPPVNKNIIGAGTLYLTEPLALEVLASSVYPHETEIVDMRIEENALAVKLKEFMPDIVGITGNTVDVYNILKIARTVKEADKSIVVIIGGHHATMVPMDFNNENIDMVVIGEGEFALIEIVKILENKGDLSSIRGIAYKKDREFCFTKERKLNCNLDTISTPARNLTAKYRNSYFRGNWRPVTSMMTSRGCPFRCSFCALWKVMRGKYFVRSPQSVVDELLAIREPYIDFAEDNFLHDIKRADSIYRLIKERGIKKTYKLYARSDTIFRHPDIIRKWKEIGTELVLVGFESYKDSELKKLNKGNTVKNNEESIRILQEEGIEVAAYFIVNPDYSEDNFKELLEYVKKLKLTQPIFTVLTPLPGTDLYNMVKSKLITQDYEKFDFIHSVLPTKLPPERFYNSLIHLYEQSYKRESSSIKSSMSGKLINQVNRALKGAAL